MDGIATEAAVTEEDLLRVVGRVLPRKLMEAILAFEATPAPVTVVEVARSVRAIQAIRSAVEAVAGKTRGRAPEDELGSHDNIYRRPVGDGPEAHAAWMRILEHKIALREAARAGHRGLQSEERGGGEGLRPQHEGLGSRGPGSA